jgi:predicted nucleotidyltransferase
MVATIEEHMDEIIALCKEYGVARLEIFGSAVTGEFDPEKSDFDFLVEYPDNYDFGPWGARRFALQDRLAELLGRKVDLVIFRNIENPYVVHAVQQSRTLLYAA